MRPIGRMLLALALAAGLVAGLAWAPDSGGGASAQSAKPKWLSLNSPATFPVDI